MLHHHVISEFMLRYSQLFQDFQAEKLVIFKELKQETLLIISLLNNRKLLAAELPLFSHYFNSLFLLILFLINAISAFISKHRLPDSVRHCLNFRFCC